MRNKSREIRTDPDSLRDERRLLRALLDHLPDQVLVKDRELRFVTANLRAAEQFGISSTEQVEGKTDYDFVPQKLALEHERDDRTVLESGRPIKDREELVIDAEGNKRHVMVTKVPLKNAAGRVQGLVGISRDVTKHKKLEEQLRESEARFRGAFLQAPIGVALQTVEGLFTHVNGALCRMLGYSEEDLLGRSYKNFTHPEDAPADTLHDDELLHGSGVHTGQEKRYLRKDGTLCWVLVSAAALRDEQGTPTGRVVLSQDITARKHAEAELVRFAEVSRDILFVTDFDYKFRQLNPAFARITAWSQEEFIGESVLKLVHRDDRGMARESFKRLAAGELLDGFQCRVVCKDDSVRWLSWNASPVPEDAVLYGAARDISGSKRMETELRVNHAQLQNLAGQLMNAHEEERRRIARELHDDLTQRIAMLGIELGFLTNEVGAVQAAIAPRMEAVHRQVIELTDHVRSISHQLHPGSLEHSGLVPALKSHCTDFERLNGIPAQIVVKEDLPSLPRSVSTALYRIAQESMRNAAKHSGASILRISLASERDAVVMMICDDGSGFEAGELKAKGGLGLISMEERARSIGGALSLKSEPQKGTTVRVRVPLANIQE